MRQTNNWGGHRTGSGRKKNDSLGNKKYVYFEIDDETNKNLEKLYKAMKQFYSYTLTRKEIFRIMVEDSLEIYELELDEKNYEFQEAVSEISNEFASRLFDCFYILNEQNKTNGVNPFILFEGVGYSEQKNKLLKTVQVKANKISVSSFIKENLSYYNDYVTRDITEIKRILFKIRHKFDEVFDLIIQGKFDSDKWKYEFIQYAKEVGKSSLYE